MFVGRESGPIFRRREQVCQRIGESAAVEEEGGEEMGMYAKAHTALADRGTVPKPVFHCICGQGFLGGLGGGIERE